MKLKIKKAERHTDVVASCCWSPDNNLFSLSDDKTILQWNFNGEYIDKFMDLNSYCTACEFSPSSKTGNDSIALGTSDGSLMIISKLEKLKKLLKMFIKQQ